MKRLLIVTGLLGMTWMLIPRLGFSNVEPAFFNQEVPFTIQSNRRTGKNRLVIPRKFLQNAGAVGLQGAGNPGAAVGTVIAGLAISVSIVSLVFLLIRRKSRAAQALALFVAVGASGFLWSQQAKADVPPTIAGIPERWKRVAQSDKNVIIEITDQGDEVQLILGTRYRGSGGKTQREPKPPRSQPPQDGSARPEKTLESR